MQWIIERKQGYLPDLSQAEYRSSKPDTELKQVLDAGFMVRVTGTVSRIWFSRGKHSTVKAFVQTPLGLVEVSVGRWKSFDEQDVWRQKIPSGKQVVIDFSITGAAWSPLNDGHRYGGRPEVITLEQACDLVR